MYELIIGKRDSGQFDDNIYYLNQSSVCRIYYQLPIIPTYTKYSNFKKFNFPPEIWEKIFDLVSVELIREFNYKIFSKFLQVSKTYMECFYDRFFGRDFLVYQKISTPEKYFRLSHTLYTLDRLVNEIYIHESNRFELKMDSDNFENFPLPWDIINVKFLNPVDEPIIYNPKSKNIWNPKSYKIGDGICLIHGNISQSIIEAEYMRLPTIILKVVGLGSSRPKMRLNFLRYSQSWRAFSKFLSLGLGKNTGVYFSVLVSDLPDELIFNDQVLIET